MLSVICVLELSPDHVVSRLDWSKETVAAVAFAMMDWVERVWDRRSDRTCVWMKTVGAASVGASVGTSLREE